MLGRRIRGRLRDDFDESDVLVCRAHYGRLRRMDAWRLDELERDLHRAFALMR